MNQFAWHCDTLIRCEWCKADYYERLEDGGAGRCRRCGDELGTRWTHRTARPFRGILHDVGSAALGVVGLWWWGDDPQIEEARDLELRGHLGHALVCAVDRWRFDSRDKVVMFNDATIAVVHGILHETMEWFEEAHDVDLSGVQSNVQADGFMRTFNLTIDTRDW